MYTSHYVKCKMKFTFMIEDRKHTLRQIWNHYFQSDIKLNILTKIMNYRKKVLSSKSSEDTTYLVQLVVLLSTYSSLFFSCP